MGGALGETPLDAPDFVVVLGGGGGEGYLFRAALDQFFSRAGICFPDILPLVPSGFN